MLRLVRTLGTLRFDELQIFGMQLTDWHNFDDIVRKIERFRMAKMNSRKNYHQFKAEFLRNELKTIYAARIAKGETKTRESDDRSLDKFFQTQSSNMRDYADACFRYLRATGLVHVSHAGKSLSIVSTRIADVDFLLATIDRNPIMIQDEAQYISYLGDAVVPALLTDDRQALVRRLQTEYPAVEFDIEASTEELKDLLSVFTDNRKSEILKQQIQEIKDYKLYDEIQHTFEQIKEGKLYDAPLMLEWNTWRAMTMLDGGTIKAHLNFDDFGNPLSTAQGNLADIECDYGDYLLNVEVTMTSGQKQYDAEGEPVSRHLGKTKAASGRPCYCLFIAPTINEACVAHFYALHHVNISYYGGKSVIVPLPLSVFQKMLENSYRADSTPSPKQVRKFFEDSKDLSICCTDEMQWFEEVKHLALTWSVADSMDRRT